jgi:hypothetical protein
MRDTEYKRLIDAAKERALSGFQALVQRAIQDADKGAVQLMATAKSGPDQTALSSLRHFLRQDGTTFLRHIDTLFRGYLERAMQTMYVDLRPGMREISADELSLIDDEVVNHQIEVGRLTGRMRDANEENIGRLNVIIAQLHGEREARERENPFRPYLLARSLYEALRVFSTDDPKMRVLFEHISNAMIQHLPNYYTSIREVFEASGVAGRFVALPARTAHHQRYFGAPPADAHTLPVHFESRVAPGLQRMLEAMQQLPLDGMQVGTGNSLTDQQASVQRFIRSMVTPSMSSRAGTGAMRSGIAPSSASQAERASARLLTQLNEFQAAAARAEAMNDKMPEAGNQLFALRDKLDLGHAPVMDRMTFDVVAMLFEFVLEDKQIPAELRRHISRLQIPMAKAAVLAPDLLQQERHPARQLLNRISSAAAATDPATQAGRQLTAEIDRVTSGILSGFGSDMTVFSSALAAFEQFMEERVRHEGRDATSSIDAVELAEKLSILLTNVRTTLCDVLLPLNIDKRVSDFIIHVWPHVLVHAAWQDLESQAGTEHPDSLFQRYRAVLPELVWSIQEKPEANERSALMRMLPGLVKSLNGALQLIRLPDDECKDILDRLMALHAQVLRGGQKEAAGKTVSLDELRADFSRLAIHWDRVSWSLTEPPQARADLIEEVLALRGVAAELRLGQNTAVASQADREFLAQTYLLGTRVAFSVEGGEPQPATLAWVSTHRSLYLFRLDGDQRLAIYTSVALLEALSQGSVVPVEYAPVFERAVEALLFGAEKIGPA